ncbi:methionine adenosyltransferase [Tepidamorphus sp. 3E244]|uniref:methionine adenosyltransferase n=1 Tax=Tepidamorphus sp. 3E244 TaxID=3385498 RepID=UPI0038FCB93D
MARSNFIFTSESVSEGHPDKVCDRISDEVVDLFFREAGSAGMPASQVRVACETLATTNRVVIAGEVRGPDGLCHEQDDGEISVNTDKIVGVTREAIKSIGYDQKGFSWRDCQIEVLLHGQSAHIAQGVDEAGNKDTGAGDQGIMFGYACRETPEYMPAPIYYAHRILAEMAEARHAGKEPVLGPDAKSQVSVAYENGKPVRATQIVVSTQHMEEGLSSQDIRKIVAPYVLSALPDGWVNDDTAWHINPTGAFVIGGPDGDAGLTGRKIIVDTYGGAAPHGGGAFSGKDPTKVDRSAAYAARYVAKNIVAAELAERCTIQLSYAIGVAEPLSIYVDTDGTGKISNADLEKAIRKTIALTPSRIRDHLQLNKAIYARTAAYGHFGRVPEPDGGFSWEALDLVDELRANAK